MGTYKMALAQKLIANDKYILGAPYTDLVSQIEIIRRKNIFGGVERQKDKIAKH